MQRFKLYVQSAVSPKQVAEAMMVSESSIKRWCDQGLIPTIKTAGGHRRITIEALTDFLKQQDRSLSKPQALGIDPSAMAPLSKSARFDFKATVSETQSEFSKAVAEGDEPACREMIRAFYLATGSITQIVEEIFVQTMKDIGDSWQCGDLEVYQERRCCEICLRLIDLLGDLLPTLPSDAPVAIGCSASGDSYQIPTRLVQLILREAGWNATSIGCDVPFQSLSVAIVEYQPRIIWVSASVVDDRKRFAEQFNTMSAHLSSDQILIAGGRALDDDLRPQLNYTAYCDNLTQLADLATATKRRSLNPSQSKN